MKSVLLCLLLLLFTLFSEAQQALPKGGSFFGRIAFNQPFNFRRYYDYGISRNLDFNPGLSGSVGILHYGRGFCISPSLRCSFISGVAEKEVQLMKGYLHNSRRFNILNTGGEIIFSKHFGKNQNVSLGVGLQAGFSIVKKNYSTNSSTYSPTANNEFSDMYKGLVADIKFSPKKLVRDKFSSSFGIRFLYTNTSNSETTMINEYIETEIYFALNFYKKKERPFK